MTAASSCVTKTMFMVPTTDKFIMCLDLVEMDH